MRNLTILQVASHDRLERGGAIQMFRLAEGLRRRGHAVHCAIHSANVRSSKTEQAREAFEAAGLPFEAFDMNSLGDHARFRAWAGVLKPDAIHTHRELALRFVYLSTLGMPLPCFVTNRGTVYRPKGAWMMERRILRSAKLHRVIAVAEAVRRAILEQASLPPEKVLTVYGGVDCEEFSPAVSGGSVRADFGVGPEGKLIVHVGSLVAKKGIEDLLLAFQRVAQAEPAARLALVGGGKTDEVAAWLGELGLETRTRFVGHVTDVRPYYAAADAVVCASTKGEGLTGTLREALAMARPVVSTDVAGNGEIVRDGETGRLVPIGDAAALADALLFTLRETEAAKRMAEAGRAWVVANCDERVRSERVERVYWDVLGTAPG